MEDWIDDYQRIKLLTLIDYHQFVAVKQELKQLRSSKAKELDTYADFALSIYHGDFKTIDRLGPSLGFDFMTQGSPLERRVYTYFLSMTRQLWQEEYGDYLRALTPLLVDLFRLAIIKDGVPNLDDYLQPIEKVTVQGPVIYRGLQWSQSAIERSDNPIQLTWRRYYGKNFNYEHYVSSSHLMKIIQDYAGNSKLIKLCQTLRNVEKYLRNLVAHEAVLVDYTYFIQRIDLSPIQVHALVLELMELCGINQKSHLTIVERIQDCMRDLLQQ